MITISSSNVLLPALGGLLYIGILAGFSIGLTFAPCYSSMCIEHWFPYYTRIYVAAFYSLITFLAAVLIIRRQVKPFRAFTERYLLSTPFPLIGLRVTVGGLLLCILIPGIVFGSIGWCNPVQHNFWMARGELADWTQWMYRVIWTAVTGHWCDLLLGLVFLPIGRDGILSRAFRIHASTFLLAHKLLAYSLCTCGLIHGFLYYSFLGAFVQDVGVPRIERIFGQFGPDDPLRTEKEVKEAGIYGWFPLPTGALAGIVLIPTMIIAAIPVLRRKSYNTFYFIHIIFACVVLVVLCLHTSTSFYCVLPGLLLWVYDWSTRLHHSLFMKTTIQLEAADNDWYRIRLPKEHAPEASKPSKRHSSTDDSIAEKGGVTRDRSSPIHSPLQTYHIRVRDISKPQIHPFTAAVPETGTEGAVLLFRKGPERKKENKRDKEWTWQMAALAEQSSEKAVELTARVEGPHSTFMPERIDHILAIVGGTGITGAMALAHWYIDLPSASRGNLKIVWTVRTPEIAANLEEVTNLQILLAAFGKRADLVIHCTETAGCHIDPEMEVKTFAAACGDDKVWCYISGPGGLSRDAEAACVRQAKALRGGEVELDWYTASFAV